MEKRNQVSTFIGLRPPSRSAVPPVCARLLSFLPPCTDAEKEHTRRQKTIITDKRTSEAP